MNRRKQTLERVWLWFFPRRCVWCMGVTRPLATLCPDCETQAAPHSTAPSLLEGTQIPLVSAFDYHSRASRILLNLKFHGGHKYAHSIGYAMGDAMLAACLPDKPEQWLFCCVPMTAAQVKARGYNQSELIAKAAARWVGAAYAPGLLRKLRETQAQHDLPAALRRENVDGAFAAAQPDKIVGQSVVLCDDICTTGATLRACVRALEEAGAREVVCLTYLRTELEEPK